MPSGRDSFRRNRVAPSSYNYTITVRGRASSLRLVLIGLLGLVVSLLLVGAVSGTPLRHLVQVTPVAIAWVAVWRRTPWAVYGGMAVFLVWLTLMTFIWLFFLGIAKILTGHFTLIEITLTIAVGAFCILGLVACFRSRVASAVISRIAAFVVFAVFQLGCLWVSFQPFISRR